jgi:tetratricopeptide (TPR) repeat protein
MIMQVHAPGKKLAILTLLLVACLPDPLAWSAAPESGRSIAQAQYKVRRHPNNPAAYYQLGDAYVQRARESGDPAYFELAEQSLKKALGLNPEQRGARRHLAYVMALRHDFAAAAAEAEKAIGLDRGDVDAYAILGDAYLEIGKLEQAEEAYRAMMALKESLSSYSRLSGLKSLRGDTEGALADLQKAIELGRENNQPSESIAWAEWQLAADYFSRGDLAQAESFYQQALRTYPGYFRALAGLAQVRAAQQRYDDAVGLYQKAIGAVPMLEYIAALGDLYTRSNRSEEARKQYELVEYIGKLSALNQALYNRELAYFYADHDLKPAEGLRLAERELENRRDIYAYDVLAWSLLKNGKLEQAREAIHQALRLGTRDAKLFYHAGMIYLQSGENETAAKYLRQALSTNPHFHLLFAEDARRSLGAIDNSHARVAAGERSEGR